MNAGNVVHPTTVHPYAYHRGNTSEGAYKAMKQHLPDADAPMQAAVLTDRVNIRAGRPIPPGRNITRMERLRKWSAANPRLSTAAAMASIVALSTSLALVSGWAIDELAHLTDRKNDKVGLVFGAVVGLALAITQTVQLFSLARRGEIYCKANSFSPDIKTADGQSYALIRERNPVLLHALRNNARSEMARSHSEISFTHDDVYRAMNTVAREGWGPDRWRHFLTEVEHVPVGNQAFFKATTTSKVTGFTAGKYYVSNHRNVNDFLDAEVTRHFGAHNEIAHKVIDAAKLRRAANEAARKATSDSAPADVKAKAKARAVAAESEALIAERIAKNSFLLHSGNAADDKTTLKELESKWSQNSACDGSYDRLFSRLSELDSAELDALKRAEKLSGNHDALRHDLFNRIDDAAPNTTGGKSWVRVDELTKIGPALAGLRPASLHSWVQNFRDSFFSFAGSLDANTQGRNAGTSLFSFVPFALLVSVIGVLCLGMSSTSSGGGASSADAKKKQLNGNGVSPFSVFPAFENGANANKPAPVSASSQSQPQTQQIPQTPLMQALNVNQPQSSTGAQGTYSLNS